MPPKGKADLAHPEAADWVMGTLEPAQAEDFQHHLTGCPHCQAAVAEFGQLGQMLQHLPPAAEPPPGLEARVISSVLAAATEDRTPTKVHQSPAVPPATPGDPSSTQVIQIPASPSKTGADERSGGIAKVIRFPHWPGRAGQWAIAGAVAAAIIAAVVILPALGGGSPAQALTLKLGSPSGQAASGVATARPDASGSWDITLNVQHLTNLGEVRFYECWWIGPGRPGHRKMVSAGTFIVGDNGSGTFSLTSAVDPHQFPIIQIIAESPSNNGAPHGTVVLTGKTKL